MSLLTEIMNRLSSQSVGGLTSTATWRIVGRDFLPGSIGGSTKAQQICVTPTGGFDQEYAEALTYPTFQTRIRGSSTGSTGLEAKVEETVKSLNLLGPYRPYGTMYVCTDPTAAADSQLTHPTTVSSIGTVTLTFFIKAGTSTQSRVRYYRNSTGVPIVDATVTWSSGVPAFSMTTGTLVSSTKIGDFGVYQVVMTGTAVAADTHIVLINIANAVSVTSTGTLYLGGWTIGNATASSGSTTDMTTWSASFSATCVESNDFPRYLDILQQGDLLFLGRDEVQRPIYAVNFVASRSRTT